jgi:hypothetical protein
MDKTRTERLIEIATPEEKATLTTLFNASAKTLKAYQTDNTSSKLRDWQAADAALSAKSNELEAKYFGKPESFANVMEALQFLKARGYKVAKSKVYADAKKGLLKVQEDKSVLEADVLAYAVRAELEKTPEKASKIDDSVFADKAAAELQLLEVRKKKLLFEHEKQMGLYLLKSDVHAEIAMKLGAIEAGFKHLVAVRLADWIEAAGGDTQTVDDVRESIYTDIDGMMNEFCSFDELAIVIRPAGCAIDADDA